MADELETLEVRLTAEEKGYLRSVRAAAKATKKATRDIDRATDNIKGHWRDAAGRLRDVRGRYARSVDRMGDETEGLSRRVRRVTRGIVAAFSRMTGAVGRLARSLTRVLVPAMGIATAGIAALGAGAVAFGVKSIQMASRTEDLQGALEVITGSAEKAEKTLKSLAVLDVETPLSASEINEIAKSLLAFGTPADKVVEEIRNIGDVALILSQNVNEVAQIYGKAKVQGRLFAEDINQFTGRGIGVYEELQKVVSETGKVTGSELDKMVSAGEVSFKHLEQAFDNMTAAGGRFHNGMKIAAQSTSGRFSALQNHLSLTMRDIGKVLTEEFSIKDAVSNIAEQAGEARDDIVDAFREVVLLVKDMGAAINEEFELIGDGFDLGSVLENADEAAKRFRKDFMPIFREILPQVGDFLSQVRQGFQDFIVVLQKIWPTVKVVTSVLWDHLEPILEWIKANPKLAASLLTTFIAIKRLQLVLGTFGTSIRGVTSSILSMGTALGDKRGVARSLKTFGVRSKGVRRILVRMSSTMSMMFGPAGLAVAGSAAFIALAQSMQSWGKATKSTNEILRDTTKIIEKQLDLADQQAEVSDEPVEALKKQRKKIDEEIMRARGRIQKIRDTWGIETWFGVRTGRGVEIDVAKGRIEELRKAGKELTEKIDKLEQTRAKKQEEEFQEMVRPIKDAFNKVFGENFVENQIVKGAEKAGKALEDAADKSKEILGTVGLGGIFGELGGPVEAPKPPEQKMPEESEKRLANAMERGSSEALSTLNKAAERNLDQEAVNLAKQQLEEDRKIAKNTKTFAKRKQIVFQV